MGFFVISGYLVTMLLVREEKRLGRVLSALF
jgi:peptidoglycan/LPS O-acetylase OafA/YrhL